ncbi:MAG: DUF4345 family protein [Blastomonas sp.]
MVWIIRILVVLYALLFGLMGIRGMLDPDSIMTQFMLMAPDQTGRSAIRADMGAFFIVSAAGALLGLMPRQRHWLLVPVALFGLAFTGRAIGLALEGATQPITEAMLIEAISVGMLVFAYVFLRKRDMETIEKGQSGSDSPA